MSADAWMEDGYRWRDGELEVVIRAKDLPAGTYTWSGPHYLESRMEHGAEMMIATPETFRAGGIPDEVIAAAAARAVAAVERDARRATAWFFPCAHCGRRMEDPAAPEPELLVPVRLLRLLADAAGRAHAATTAEDTAVDELRLMLKGVTE